MVPSRDRGGEAAGLARIVLSGGMHGPAIARTNLEYVEISVPDANSAHCHLRNSSSGIDADNPSNRT